MPLPAALSHLPENTGRQLRYSQNYGAVPAIPEHLLVAVKRKENLTNKAKRCMKTQELFL